MLLSQIVHLNFLSEQVLPPAAGALQNDNDNEPPLEIEAHTSVADNMSKVSEQSRPVLGAATVPVASPHIGQPATPPIRSFKNMNGSMFEERYDSDGLLGPFFDQVMYEGFLLVILDSSKPE